MYQEKTSTRTSILVGCLSLFFLQSFSVWILWSGDSILLFSDAFVFTGTPNQSPLSARNSQTKGIKSLHSPTTNRWYSEEETHNNLYLYSTNINMRTYNTAFNSILFPEAKGRGSHMRMMLSAKASSKSSKNNRRKNSKIKGKKASVTPTVNIKGFTKDILHQSENSNSNNNNNNNNGDNNNNNNKIKKIVNKTEQQDDGDSNFRPDDSNYIIGSTSVEDNVDGKIRIEEINAENNEIDNNDNLSIKSPKSPRPVRQPALKKIKEGSEYKTELESKSQTKEGVPMTYNIPQNRARRRQDPFTDVESPLPSERMIDYEIDFLPEANSEERTKYRLPNPTDDESMIKEISRVFDYSPDKLKNLSDPVANEAREQMRSFYLANRDWLGMRIKMLMSSKKHKMLSEMKVAEATSMHNIMRNYIKIEQSINYHFLQGVADAEQRLAENVGNSPGLPNFAGNSPVELASFWIVLKSVLAVWEQKRVEIKDSIDLYAEKIAGAKAKEWAQKGETLNSEVDKVERVTFMFQQMNLALTNNKEIMSVLPIEFQFLEIACGIGSGTELRQFAIKEFCPENNISIETLREKIRNVLRMVEGLRPTSNGPLAIKIHEIHKALAMGISSESQGEYVDAYLNGNRFDTYSLDYADPTGLLQGKARAVGKNPFSFLDVALSKIGLPVLESEVEALSFETKTSNPWLDKFPDIMGFTEKDMIPLKPPAATLKPSQDEADQAIADAVPNFGEKKTLLETVKQANKLKQESLQLANGEIDEKTEAEMTDLALKEIFEKVKKNEEEGGNTFNHVTDLVDITSQTNQFMKSLSEEDMKKWEDEVDSVEITEEEIENFVVRDEDLLTPEYIDMIYKFEKEEEDLMRKYDIQEQIDAATYNPNM